MSAVVSERCEAIIVFLGIDCGRCPEEADGRFTGACVHEHVHTRWLCTGHVEAHKAAMCRDCHDGPQSHECAIVLAPAAVTS